MKVRAVAILLLLAATGLWAQTSQNAIVGTWESDQKDVRMDFFQDGDQYNGKLLWGNKVVEANGSTSKRDFKNPDKSLRARDVLGSVTLTGLKWTGKDYTAGRIYDPPTGKTYDCKVWIEGDKLHLRGFMGFSMMGKTVTWHRYPANKQ